MEVSREEAKRILRRLELEAYSSIVSTFRAQGDLNREKKKLLTDLGAHLSISTERHRAEVRRAYSDDRLGAVAERIVGPSTCSEWAAEGRRLVPLMPRLVPQTVLSGTATASANAAAASNAQIAQAKKVTGTVTKDAASTSAKQSPSKPLARQSSEPIDVEYDSDDNKPKKKRKISQSLTIPKPVQKVSLNPSIASGNKTGTKTASVSTSTITKGKPPTSVGPVKTTQKLVLPSSQSQVKLLTKTVSINQTASQAKTLLNYKTVSAANPVAVKAQTVMSHTVTKPQVKITVPSKSVLVPKVNTSTSPTKAISGISPLKSGLTMSQLASKQRGKQPARFKPLPGAVKFKSVNALAMGLPSLPVTMATPSTSITTLAGSTIQTVSGTQPVVRVIQVPGAVSNTTGKTVQPTMVTTSTPKPTPLPISGSSAITKIPISTNQSQLSRTVTSMVQTTAKTVVMTTIVGGTKKVVLSVPAPVAPIQAIPGGNVNKPTKTTGLTTQQVLSTGDATTKTITDKKDTAIKMVTVPSLECTEPSSVLQAPLPIVPKPGTTQIVSSQVRTRPLQTLLPAPPKPVIVTSTTTLASNTVVRKLPQILPAPVKTTVMLPVTKPSGQTISTTSNTVIPANTGKVPLVQFMAKTTPPTVVTKLCVSKTVPVVSTKVSPAPGTLLIQPGQQITAPTKSAPPLQIGDSPIEGGTPTAVETEGSSEKDKSLNNTSSDDVTVDDKVFDSEESKTDSNTSSEDDSLLVCSETIDSGAGLQEMREVSPEGHISAASVEAFAMSTPLKPKEPFDAVRDDVLISATENKESKEAERDSIVTPTKPLNDNPKVVVQVLDALEPTTQLNCEEFSAAGHRNVEKDQEKDTLKENNSNLNDDFDKIVSDEEFDVVSSFLESFSQGQTAEKLCCNEAKSELNNKKTDIVQESTETGVENLKDIEKNEKLHDNEVKRPTDIAASSSSSIVSSFDFLDIPVTLDNQTEKPNVNIQDSNAINSMNILSEKKPNVEFQDTTANSCANVLPDSSFDVQSLKEFAQKSVEKVISDSHAESTQNTNIIRNNPSDISTKSTLSFTSNETDSPTTIDGQELSESEKLALEAIANVRTSSRKRKPPTVLTLSPPRQTSGWIRGALSLLQKVCSYRGQGRKKGDYSAASWFLRPVDPNEAPGYFKVIKNPMDLSTIKTKLETGSYKDYMEFHDDMILIKSNCFKYNPPGHDIWKDCEEVFNYFEAEYEKMLDRWEKCHVSPAKKPRTVPKQDVPSSVTW